MSMTMLISFSSLVSALENKSLLFQRSPVLSLGSISCVASLNGVNFPVKQSFSLFSTSQRGLRNLAVYASVPPAGAPNPPSPPSKSWRNWILGMVITLILPFFTHKWGPLQTILKRIDNAAETAEEIADGIEAVAEKVDKVAEDISDDLPKGGRLRKAADFIENAAERIAKDAHFVGDLMDEVEEFDEKVESLIEKEAHHRATKAAKLEKVKPLVESMDDHQATEVTKTEIMESISESRLGNQATKATKIEKMESLSQAEDDHRAIKVTSTEKVESIIELGADHQTTKASETSNSNAQQVDEI